MAQLPELDFQAYVDKKRTERAGGGPETTGHEYAYISDRQTRAAFERMKAVELAVQSTVRVFKQVGKGQLLGNAVKVSEKQFPRIRKLVDRCAETLHIPAPEVYIVNSPVLNAATYGTNEDAFIMVHSALIDHYSDEELLTVIGHECGHIHNQHVVYLTALHYLTHAAGTLLRVVGWALEPALIALRAWSRRAEITSDRAGMLCGKSDVVAARALTKLALGSKKLYEEFNLDAFLEQYEEGKNDVGRYMEVFATHPWLPKRVLAMRTFAESELYRKAASLGEGGISMKEVDDRVLALLKGDA
ncbi:M48 family metallopeptidase [Pendulispora albinea]|uniref:M48 family metallopeptidase n=1 Tax=Pendulispora albinea TaxID=2741071 RepID=A0ABZ2LPD4_9BACT